MKDEKVGGEDRKPLLTPWEQGTTTASSKGREQIAQIRLHLSDDISIEQRLLCSGWHEDSSCFALDSINIFRVPLVSDARLLAVSDEICSTVSITLPFSLSLSDL